MKKSMVYTTFWAVLALALCLVIIAMELLSSEAFLLQGARPVFLGMFAVLSQPYDLVMGNMSLDQAKATLWAYGCELTYMMCVVGWGVARDAVGLYNQKLVGWMKTGAIALVVLNTWTNAQYSPLASGFFGQAAFALLMSLASVGLPLVSAYLLVGTFAKGGIAPTKKYPLISIVVGALLVVFGLSYVLMDIQTSEAFIAHLPITHFYNNLATIRQPWDLFSGVITDPATVVAVIWGWTIESLYMICIVGWEVFGSAFGLHNPKFARWFMWGALLAIGFNLVSNFFYGDLPSGPWGQFLFSFITSFGSAFFPMVGTYLIELSLTELGGSKGAVR